VIKLRKALNVECTVVIIIIITVVDIKMFASSSIMNTLFYMYNRFTAVVNQTVADV